MGRMKLTQEQLDIIKRLLPLYELNEKDLADDLLILDSRVHGAPVSEQVAITHWSRATVFRRISCIQAYYDQMRLDYPEYNLPVRKKSKEEEYMDTH